MFEIFQILTIIFKSNDFSSALSKDGEREKPDQSGEKRRFYCWGEALGARRGIKNLADGMGEGGINLNRHL